MFEFEQPVRKSRPRAIVVFALILAGMASPAALFTTRAADGDGPLAYKNATIETVASAGRIESGTVVVRDGKIEAVGKDAAIPDDALVIDAKGFTILPGLVEPFYVQREGGGDGGTRTLVIGGRTITLPAASNANASRSFARMSERFSPYEWKSSETLRSGLTTLNLTSMGYGQSAILRNDPKRGEEMILQADGLLFVSVSNDSTSLGVVRSALRAAARAKSPGSSTAAESSKKAAETKKSEGASSKADTPAASPSGSGRSSSPPNPASRAAELWQDIHDGKALLIASTQNAAGVVHLLAAIEDYKEIKLVLMAPAAAVQEAFDAIKERKAKVLLRPTIDIQPYTRDRVNVPRMLNDAGIEFAFLWTLEMSEMRANQETPLLPLGYLVKTGLPRTIALEAATIRPARILGLDKSLGSIEKGKSANLLIFDGDPLDAQSRLRQALVEGRTVYEFRP